MTTFCRRRKSSSRIVQTKSRILHELDDVPRSSWSSDTLVKHSHPILLPPRTLTTFIMPHVYTYHSLCQHKHVVCRNVFIVFCIFYMHIESVLENQNAIVANRNFRFFLTVKFKDYFNIRRQN